MRALKYQTFVAILRWGAHSIFLSLSKDALNNDLGKSRFSGQGWRLYQGCWLNV